MSNNSKSSLANFTALAPDHERSSCMHSSFHCPLNSGWVVSDSMPMSLASEPLQVFEGELRDAGETHPVVLKRVKQRVEGAQEAVQMEHMLNALVAKTARGASAHFMGYLNVQHNQASGRLTQAKAAKLLVMEYAKMAFNKSEQAFSCVNRCGAEVFRNILPPSMTV
eukprot:scaffold16441_cov31-Prasinocladus_malaysianus.AAC.2